MKVKSKDFKQHLAGRSSKRPNSAGSGGAAPLDRFIIPRVRQYADNNSIEDVDEVAEHLRAQYREYQRQKVQIFRMQVARAVIIVSQEHDREEDRPEVLLQAMEQRHLSNKAAGSSKSTVGKKRSRPLGLFLKDDGDDEGDDEEDEEADSSSEMTSSDESDDDEDDEEEDDEEEEDASVPVPDIEVKGMNASLLSMYSQKGGGAQGAEGEGDEDEDDLPPFPYKGAAFAPPDVIAAAAARALAAEKAEKEALELSKANKAQEIKVKVMSGKPVLELTPSQVPINSLKQPLEVKAQEGIKPKPAPHSQVQPPKKKARKGLGGGMEAGGLASGGSALTNAKPLSYSDLGGIDEVLLDIKELIEYPLKHPEVYSWLGVEPPRGVLLHGPPGCGKTALANAIANECGVPFLRVSAPEVVSGMSGESEAKLRSLFQEASHLAPCIVFIDEIDAIFPKRDQAQREMERRIVAQMLTCMDDLSSIPPSIKSKSKASAETSGHEVEGKEEDEVLLQDPPKSRPHVVVIGATNRPDAMDSALRRAGRFDREISLGIPTEEARVRILQVISRKLRLEGAFEFKRVAKMTPGFVGADLSALCKEAAAIAVTRIFHQPSPSDRPATSLSLFTALPADRFGTGPLTFNELQGLAITMSDFELAVSKVQPSIRREGFATTPDVTWEDVGSLDEIKEELNFSITQPIRHPERFEAMGLPSAAGVLLYGPPGCGKTLVAKAVASDASANFISIKGPELLNKYVGESERAVRQLFSRARAAKPCVLFFDEMDALAPRRGGDSSNQAAERLVNQLLTEMDGVESRSGVFLIAATNRPDMIDPALLRPGRLEKVLYVPLPPPDGRVSVLRALTRKSPLDASVDLEAIGRSTRCDGFSGADCAALVREASVIALKESLQSHPFVPVEPHPDAPSLPQQAAPLVYPRHFELALDRVMPSVSKRDVKLYDSIRMKLRGPVSVAKGAEKQDGEKTEVGAGLEGDLGSISGGIQGFGAGLADR